MNQQKRNIVWEPYFIDEYGINEEDESETDDDEENEGFDYEEKEVTRKIKNMPKILITPFGPYRIDDTSNPLKRFEFWIGHTNFRIGNRVYTILNSTPGVEALMVTTPYRFIIACAKMFNFADLRVNIERQLCGKHMIDAYLSQINDEKILLEVRKCLNAFKGSKYWTVYIMPNGYIHSFKTENRQEFMNNFNVFSEARNISNGILITSEDDYDHTPNIKV